MKNLLAIGVLLAAAAQLAVPASMLRGRERTLREGEVFLFACAPVDPYDAFRGRYVRLSVNAQDVPLAGEPFGTRRKRALFASLGRDGNGFAVVTGASRTRPPAGAFVRAEAWVRPHEATVSIRPPIDRYYLPEHEAPAAERAYAEHARADRGAAVAVVRVRNGDLVVEDVRIDGVPLREWVARRAETP